MIHHTGQVDRSSVYSAYLWHCDAAFLGQLFFGLLAGIGITEVGVEVLV